MDTALLDRLPDGALAVRPADILTDRKAAFIAALAPDAEGALPYPNVSRACKVVGISRECAYHWRKIDPIFAQAWAEAEALYGDKLEEVAGERATTTSDAMLRDQLRRWRPEHYQDVTRVQVSGQIGHTQTLDLPADQIGAFRALVAQSGGLSLPAGDVVDSELVDGGGAVGALYAVPEDDSGGG